MDARDFIKLLKGAKPSGSGWTALCPAHDDHDPSLSVGAGDDGRVLVNCHAGCSLDAILAALHLAETDLFADREAIIAANVVPQRVQQTEYEIKDRCGSVVAVHVRTDKPDGSKRFVWRRPSGESGLGGVRVADLPLFGSDLLESHAGPVYITEGEKAALALRSLGVMAVATVTGAGTSPSKEPLEVLRDREVILWPDHDELGRRHMDRIAAALKGLAKSVRLISYGQEKGADAADFIAHGGTTEELERLGATAALPAHEDSGSLLCLADVKAESVKWLWNGRIAFGKLAVVDGDPGLGKSTMMLDVAARATMGSTMPFSNDRHEPFPVVVASAEDGAADTIRPRFDAAGGDPNKLHLLLGRRDSDGFRGTLALDDVAYIEAAVLSVGARLLVLDPLSAFLSEKTDSFKDASVRRALAPLVAMAERLEMAVVVVRHLSKGGGPNPVYRGQGSIGIIGAARVGMVVGPHPDDEARCVLAVSKSNLGPKPPSLAYRIESFLSGAVETSKIVWEGSTGHTAADLVAVPVDAEVRTERDAAAAFLLDRLAEGPVAAKEIEREAREAGIHDRTLRRAKKKVGVVTTKAGMAEGWTWSLPDPPTEGGQEEQKMSIHLGVATFEGGGHLREGESA